MENVEECVACFQVFKYISADPFSGEVGKLALEHWSHCQGPPWTADLGNDPGTTKCLASRSPGPPAPG